MTVLVSAAAAVDAVPRSLDLFVAFMLDELESGVDRAELVARLAAQFLSDSDPVTLAALLAVAVGRLADVAAAREVEVAALVSALLEG